MRKRILAVFAVLIALCWLPKVARGVESPAGRIIVPLAADYDLDSVGTYIYLRTVGESGNPLGNPLTRNVRVKTTGSQSTVVASTASTAPFALNSAPPTGGGGDILYFDLKGQPDAAAPANIQGTKLVSRTLLTRPDTDTVTIDTAIDLTNGTTFFTRLFKTGTTATDGWIPVAGFATAEFSWQMKQSDASSIDVKVECESFNATDNTYSTQNQIYTKNVTVYGCPSGTGVGACDTFIFQGNLFDRCRLGFKAGSDASDAGANLEKISAQFAGMK